MIDSITPKKYRSIFISDVHLGHKACQAELLLDFLRNTESDYLFLVGDIIDGWKLRRGWYWPQPHNDVIQKILRKARKDTCVIYIPGNHDEFARDYAEHTFGSIRVEREIVHKTADGKRLLVMHGDEFDIVVRYAKWVALLGDHAYSLALVLNRWLNAVRRRLGYPYWSLSVYLKLRVKNSVNFIGDFEKALADVAVARHVDGIVCGHIHHPEIREIAGVIYCNDGDWVESCSALVEHGNGRLEIIRWGEQEAIPLLVQEAENFASSSLPTRGIRKLTALSGRLTKYARD